jgi:hypothetical protein
MLVQSPLLGVRVLQKDVDENSVLRNQTIYCAIVVLVPGHVEWC